MIIPSLMYLSQAHAVRLRHILKRLDGKDPEKMSVDRYLEELGGVVAALAEDAGVKATWERESRSPSVHFRLMGRPK